MASNFEETLLALLAEVRDAPGSSAGGITETTGAAPYFGARAWICFNGTGTVAIKSSSNIASLTDNGTGDYTITFSEAMPDANYSVSIQSLGNSSVLVGYISPANIATWKLAGSLRFQLVTTTGTPTDAPDISVSILR